MLGHSCVAAVLVEFGNGLRLELDLRRLVILSSGMARWSLVTYPKPCHDSIVPVVDVGVLESPVESGDRNELHKSRDKYLDLRWGIDTPVNALCVAYHAPSSCVAYSLSSQYLRSQIKLSVQTQMIGPSE